MFQWLYTLLKADCILKVPKGRHFVFHFGALQSVVCSLIQADDTLTASGLENFTVISHSNPGKYSDLTVRVLDEKSSQAIINAPCYSELQDLMHYVDCHTSEEYSPTPASEPMQTTYSKCTNSLSAALQQEQNRKSAKNFGKRDPLKEIYSELQSIPTKTRAKYDLRSRMQNFWAFMLTRLSRVRDQLRCDDYRHHSLELFTETMPSNAIQSPDELHEKSTPFQRPIVTGTSHASNRSTVACNKTTGFHGSPIKIDEIPSHDVQFNEATPLADATRSLSLHFRKGKYINKKVHTGAKPFECNLCDKKFTQRDNLTKHMRKHTARSQHKLRR